MYSSCRQSVSKINLENRTVVEARFVDCVDISAGKVTIAPQGFTDIDDHVNLGGGVCHLKFKSGQFKLQNWTV